MAIQCDHVPQHPLPPKTFESRVAILIPAFNEARHLPRVIEACRALKPAVVLVIDDCSTDNTLDVLAAEAGLDEHGVRVVALRNPYNLGKQGTVRRGLRLLSSMTDLDAVALMDGDGQHDAAELPRLAALLDRYDCVIGARSRDQMPPQRKLANWLVNTGFAVIAGVHFADVQSGLRLYDKPLADLLGKRLSASGGFALEHESLTVLADHARRRGLTLRFAAAPISCAYGEAVSSIGPGHIVQLAWETLRQAGRIRAATQTVETKKLRGSSVAATVEVGK